MQDQAPGAQSIVGIDIQPVQIVIGDWHLSQKGKGEPAILIEQPAGQRRFEGQHKLAVPDIKRSWAGHHRLPVAYRAALARTQAVPDPDEARAAQHFALVREALP